jgi:hypothetical protein
MCLSQRLQQLGSRLVVRRARESVQALKELVRETGAQAVFFNHLYDSISMVRDQQVKDELRAQGVVTSSFNADLLYEPWEVLDDQQQVNRGVSLCCYTWYTRLVLGQGAHVCGHSGLGGDIVAGSSSSIADSAQLHPAYCALRSFNLASDFHLNKQLVGIHFK